MKMESRARKTITRDHIDLVDKMVTNNKDSLQILAVTQLTGISEQSVHRICFGLSLAKSGTKVHPCPNIPGEKMCNMINEKYAHVIARNECNKIHERELERENLIHAYANNKSVKDVGKVLNFDKLVEESEPESKVQVKSDIQYLAEAVMKLAEVTTTQNKLIELLLTRIK